MRVLHSAIARGPQAITSHLHSCTLVLHAAQRTKRHLQSAEPPQHGLDYIHIHIHTDSARRRLQGRRRSSKGAKSVQPRLPVLCSVSARSRVRRWS